MSSSLTRAHQLNQLADAQAGYFTAIQALELGYHYPAQHYHVKQGNWQRVRHGLFRLNAYPSSPNEHLAELTLWSRNKAGQPQAVISHDTALAYHQLSDLLPEQIHLSVPPGFRKPPPNGIILHFQTVTPPETQTDHGFQVTTILRTLRDLSQVDHSSDLLQQAISQALERGDISPAQAMGLSRDGSA